MNTPVFVLLTRTQKGVKSAPFWRNREAREETKESQEYIDATASFTRQINKHLCVKHLKIRHEAVQHLALKQQMIQGGGSDGLKSVKHQGALKSAGSIFPY